MTQATVEWSIGEECSPRVKAELEGLLTRHRVFCLLHTRTREVHSWEASPAAHNNRPSGKEAEAAQ